MNHEENEKQTKLIDIVIAIGLLLAGLSLLSVFAGSFMHLLGLQYESAKSFMLYFIIASILGGIPAEHRVRSDLWPADCHHRYKEQIEPEILAVVFGLSGRDRIHPWIHGRRSPYALGVSQFSFHPCDLYSLCPIR